MKGLKRSRYGIGLINARYALREGYIRLAGSNVLPKLPASKWADPPGPTLEEQLEFSIAYLRRQKGQDDERES